MAIKMVREPSETPNINNIDDIIPMRYAYGGQNGFVIGKGTEISNTVSGLNFTVNSGRLVLQGVECDIDATGVTITIDNIATKRYCTIYLEVNLGLNTATIKDEYDTTTYPTIDAGDDLTENSTGIARLPLYQFTATSGIISEVNKIVEGIKYSKNIIVDNSVNSINAKNSILNNDGTYSGFNKDEKNILKTGTTIIPTFELIYQGDEMSKLSDDSRTFQLSKNIPLNSLLYVCCKYRDTEEFYQYNINVNVFYRTGYLAYFSANSQLDNEMHISIKVGDNSNQLTIGITENLGGIELPAYLSEVYIVHI